MTLKRGVLSCLVTCAIASAAYGDPVVEHFSVRDALIATRQVSGSTPGLAYVNGNSKTGIERLAGEAAHAYLRNLKARRSEGFRRAQAKLEARGFVQTDQVAVFRSVSLVGGRQVSRDDVTFVEDVFTTGDGELVFWSWDDGDDTTWEGSIFMASYSPEADLLANAQLDISTSLNDEPIWEETISYNPPRGGPFNQEASGDGLDTAPTRVACASDDIVAGLAGPTLDRDLVFVGSFAGMVKSWAACSLAGCAGAAVACALSGPGWAGCFNAWCMGSTVGCAVGVVLNRVAQ